MSQLQKRIHKIQRREGPGIGFGRVTREQPRAMALIATARNAAEAQAALDAGADAVLLDTTHLTIDEATARVLELFRTRAK